MRTSKACPSKQPIREVHGQHWYHTLKGTGLEINDLMGLLKTCCWSVGEISGLTSCTLFCTQGVESHLCLPRIALHGDKVSPGKPSSSLQVRSHSASLPCLASEFHSWHTV